MKNIRIIIVGLIILFLASCKEKSVDKPKVTYEAINAVKSIVKVDSSRVSIADLPIYMEGTDFLIHPIGDLNVYEGGVKSRYGSSSVNDLSFIISNIGEYEITGYLQNLKFQKINSDSIRPLTNKPALILTATYLKDIADKTNRQIMVYTMIDADTNKDGKIDTSDIKALYLSDNSGENFTKISEDFQELIDWNLVVSNNRLYFRTVEDTNKNGQFDKNDVLHYSFVDLSKKWEIKTYQPI